MADIRAFGVGNFTSVSPASFFSITVEDFKHTGAVCGLHIVLIGGPNGLPIFLPAYIHSLTTTERNSKAQELTNSEGGVFQLPDEVCRFCEEQ